MDTEVGRTTGAYILKELGILCSDNSVNHECAC